jgi:TonB-linked SusC/RagA family outer membrane protein
MSLSRFTRWSRAASIAAVALLLSTTAGAQAVITGRVTTAAAQPLAGARVVIVGTSLITATNADGQFTLRNVPTGSQTVVRVLHVGFAEQQRIVPTTAGQTSTVNFALSPVLVSLAEVVTTATGPQRRLELGNSIAQVDAAELTKTRPIETIGDLLTARAPGVQVLTGNSTGAAVRVRIRGTSSLSLNNDPIYVIDGVRMTSSNGSQSFGVGGTVFSRVGDINPQDIENIEVVKGPSAATLYGTDAANGVIVITTKRGRVGKAKWNVFVENGIIRDQNNYPTAYTLFGTRTNASKGQCFLNQIATGACTVDSLLSFNLFNDAQTTPLGTGQRQQYGLSLSGGADALSYFVSSAYEKELGVLTIPPFDRRRLDSTGVVTREEWLRPNALEKQNVRLNLTSIVSPQFDLQSSAGFIHLNQRLPQIDNNTTGLGSSAFGGPGYRNNGNGSLGFPKNGYRLFTPGDVFQETVNQQVNRFIGSASANYRPFAWMANRANIGIDYTGRTDTDLCRFGNCSDFSTNRLGFAANSRTNIRNFTVDLASSESFTPTERLNSKTTFGVQYINYAFDQNNAQSSTLPPGTSTVSAGATPSASDSYSYSKTLGLFVEEAVAVRDRLFLTAAVRTDQNSAFGTNFQQVYYPKLGVSYVISDESFFPKIRGLNQLRLRATYGAAGTQPGNNDAIRYFAATTANVDQADQPGIVIASSGNPNLKPERATEFETGFDASMLGSRVNLEFTYYSKLTRDALIARILPPSAGVSTSRFENLGSVKNAGVEAQVIAQLVDRKAFAWDLTVGGSSNANKLVDLGGVPPIIGSTIQQRAGYPLNGWWQKPIKSYADANGDGILSVNEVVVGDTAEYRGYSIPRYEITLNNGFDLFNRVLRISTLFDYKGGNLQNNGTDRIRCQSRLNCRGESDPSAPLDQQAAAIALVYSPQATQDGFFQDASYIRWRELAVTAALPSSLTSRFLRSESASLTFAGRNLKHWSRYGGTDPESSYGAGDVNSDFQTLSPPTYYTLRLNLGF